MSLLQNPLKALDQIEWYLDNRAFEKFPGAFLLAAGNLSRQVVEQILFILSFFSRLPRNEYMKPDHTLKTAGTIMNALRGVDPTSGRSYFEEARRRGPRIRKFARWPRSLDNWRRQFNEPSHFHNPAGHRRTRETHMRRFVERLRHLFDPLDPYLITAAVNEIRSHGRVRATLSRDPSNTPGVEINIVVRPRNIVRENGILILRSPKFPIRILSDTQELSFRSSDGVILVQHSVGMHLVGNFVGEDGRPIDTNDLGTVLSSLARTPSQRSQLLRHLRKLGYNASFSPGPQKQTR